MGNFNDREPNKTYMNTSDMRLNDVINGKIRYVVPGDMIQYHRGRYEHWAIYIGNGKVIQVTVEDFGGSFRNALISGMRWLDTFGRETAFAKITEESFHDVIKADGHARINNFKDKEWSILPANEIVKRAQDSLGKGGYHVLSNNCEHFATACRYGNRLSGQEEAFWSTATLGLYKRK